MSKIEELKAKLEAEQKARQEAIAETIEVRKLERKITMLSSPIFLERAVVKEDTLTLTAIISAIEDLGTGPNDKPIKNVFGYGVQPDKILTIVRSTIFAKKEHRDDIEALVGLDADLLEETNDALGSTAYFSLAEGIIVPEIRPDLELLRKNLQIIADELGLTAVNLTKLNAKNVDNLYTRARVNAEIMLENTLNYGDTIPTSAGKESEVTYTV